MGRRSLSEHLEELRVARPGLLLRTVSRIMRSLNCETPWALEIHIRDVEYRAIRRLVEDAGEDGIELECATENEETP
jgi:hypothetical protein